MQKVSFDEIVTEPYLENITVRNDFPGFLQDYLVISSLIRRHNPQNLMEIGTSSGYGTRIICRAMGIVPLGRKAKLLGRKNDRRVYSIDVPPGTDPSILYPDKEDSHPKIAGEVNKLPYTQLYGDSRTFDFSPYYPIEAWFIDGKHNYEYAKADSLQALKSKPKLIIWHDMQIRPVARAVQDVMRTKPRYSLFRVPDTRIGFTVLGKKW